MQMESLFIRVRLFSVGVEITKVVDRAVENRDRIRVAVPNARKRSPIGYRAKIDFAAVTVRLKEPAHLQDNLFQNKFAGTHY